MSVYGFFFLSGLKLFLNSKAQQPFSTGRYLRRRGVSILLPYVIAVMVYYVYFLTINYVNYEGVGQILGYLVTGNISAQLYFVVALLQFIILVPLWRLTVKRYSPVIVLPFAVILTWLFQTSISDFFAFFRPDNPFPYNDRLFTSYLIFYLAGCYAGEYYPEFCRLVEKHLGLTSVLAILAGGTDVTMCILGAARPGRVGSPEMFHFLFMTSAILALTGWALRLTKRRPVLPEPVRKLDRVSYLVYLYHCIFIVFFENRLARDIPGGEGMHLAARALFVYAAVILACLLWHWGAAALRRQVVRVRADR